MRKRNKTAVLLAAVAMAGAFLTGCGDKEEENVPAADPARNPQQWSQNPMDPDPPMPSRNPDGSLG